MTGLLVDTYTYQSPSNHNFSPAISWWTTNLAKGVWVLDMGIYFQFCFFYQLWHCGITTHFVTDKLLICICLHYFCVCVCVLVRVFKPLFFFCKPLWWDFDFSLLFMKLRCCCCLFSGDYESLLNVKEFQMNEIMWHEKSK